MHYGISFILNSSYFDEKITWTGMVLVKDSFIKFCFMS